MRKMITRHAYCLNVRNSVKMIEDSLRLQRDNGKDGLKVCGALYHIEDGKAEFL